MRSKVRKAGSLLRYLMLTIWLSVILASVGSYLMYPQAFTAVNLAAFLLRFEGWIWLIYLAMSALRGFTLLPSTPLVIAGTLLFPLEPLLVLAVSLTGILFSSGMIYFFSEFLGFSEYFEAHKPELTHKIRLRLERPSGFIFVAAWAFFPLVPTDAVCYVAGTTKMNFLEFILAVLVGESVLCTIYVFFGGAFANYLM
jgi:uncharacterized membrane protein YdjX (TVP38/TMEM64 family)